MSKFETLIPTSGPDGNIFAILGTVRRLMRELGVPQSEIDALIKKIMSAASYEEALDAVREWFPLECDPQ